VLRMRWFELVMRSSMWWPRWSERGENQREEWALMSPVIMESGEEVSRSKHLVVRVSSSVWESCVESRGGM